jgi:two-component system cell cycle response regulator
MVDRSQKMPTVLYAEDDLEHRTMVRVALGNTDIELIEAADGEEAIHKIQTEQPDLILLDLFMPKTDGYKVMQAIKDNPATQNIPIIVLSAWPTGDNRKRAKEAGAADFVIKPYDPFQLIDLIKQYLIPRSNSPQTNGESDPASLVA